MPVGSYFVDFLCRDLDLVIELDAFSHDLRVSHDARRDGWMTRQAYRILRFTNDDVFANIDGVVRQIEMTVLELQANRPTPNPSRLREGNDAITPLPLAGGVGGASEDKA